MTEQQLVRKVVLGAVVVAAAAASGCGHTAVEPAAGAAAPGVPERILPWEWWRDLTLLAVVPDGSRTVMRSSHCVSGGEKDRHSPGDSRFLRVDDDGEGVIFEVEGAGAVTRIWMVMGDGVSEPLDRAIRIRVRLDGDPRPVVDLPLPELFDGSRPPFVPPLVADVGVSGGGNISYVPIPFRDGCVISLVGAEGVKIWFQVNARLVDEPETVNSFTGREDLAPMRTLLEGAGQDPWRRPPSPTISGEVTLAPGGTETVAELEGPDLINGVMLRLRREDWQRIGLRFTFDDEEPQLIPAFDLFGIGWSNQPVARSVLFGADADDDLYCYFPMPFRRSAKIEIMRRPIEGPSRVRVEYAIRRTGSPPLPGSGLLRVEARATERDAETTDHTLMEADGVGSLVGVFVRFGPGGGLNWSFLEADERMWFGGELTPSWHGTGVEDFFGGGFYFRDPSGEPRPFLQPLHGAPVVRLVHRAAPTAYRLLLGDAVVFSDGLRVELEAVEQETGSVRVRSVAFYYTGGGGEVGDRE